MVYNSILFLLFFLPAAIGIYYLVPAGWKNGVLVLENLLFYAWVGKEYLPIAIILILLHYAAARVRIRLSNRAGGILTAFSIAATAAVLVLFKFYNFFAALFGGEISIFSVLPLGISYYSFKLISYQADVARGKTAPETNLLDFAAYVLLFPQILVGPIMRYTEIREELHVPAGRCSVPLFAEGIVLFVFGLAEKVILADGLGTLWQEVTGSAIGLQNASAPLVWLSLLAYSLQLYFDFSGFSNMSNGLLAMYGFHGKENFRFPYLSRSISEFWTRWHISLSQWFRDYVYISLGGNRRGWARQVLNLLVVWLLTGIWHCSNASMNYLLWGLYYFFLLLFEKRVLKPWLARGKVLPHIYTLLAVVLGWGIFACSSPGITVPVLFAGLFRMGGVSARYFVRNYGLLILLAILCSTPLPQKIWIRADRVPLLQPVLIAAVLLLSIAYMVATTSASALYMGF